MTSEQRRNLYAQAAIVGLAVAGMTYVFATDAVPHEAPKGWSYPYRCCWGPSSGRTGDCAMIPASTVKAVEGGYRVTLAPGDHPLVSKLVEFIVPYGEVENAPDGAYHVCLKADLTPRCFIAGGRLG